MWHNQTIKKAVEVEDGGDRERKGLAKFKNGGRGRRGQGGGVGNIGGSS